MEYQHGGIWTSHARWGISAFSLEESRTGTVWGSRDPDPRKICFDKGLFRGRGGCDELRAFNFNDLRRQSARASVRDPRAEERFWYGYIVFRKDGNSVNLPGRPSLKG